MSAAPTVIGTAAAGKRLTGLSGTWGGFGQITYRFQWYRCNAAGGGLPLDPRRDLADVPARRPGRRQDARPDGQGHGLHRDGLGVREPGRADRPAAAPARVDSAAGRDRAADPGQDRAGDDRHVEPRPREPRVPLGALQLARARVRDDSERDLQLVHGRGRRPRPRTRRDRAGDERRDDPERLQHRHARGGRRLRPRPLGVGRPVRVGKRGRRRSSSPHRTGSGRASARSSSRTGGTAATAAAATARRSTRTAALRTRSPGATSARRSAWRCASATRPAPSRCTAR